MLPHGAGSVRQWIAFDEIRRRVAFHVLCRHPVDVTDQGLAGSNALACLGGDPYPGPGGAGSAARRVAAFRPFGAAFSDVNLPEKLPFRAATRPQGNA